MRLIRLYWGLLCTRTWVRVLPLKLFCACNFGFVRLFFAHIFNASEGSLFNFFYFAEKMDVQKLPKCHFYIFRHYATYRRPKKNSKKNFVFFFQFFPHAGTVEENIWHFEVLLLFLRLRYGADLGRSWCVVFLSVMDTTGCVRVNILALKFKFDFSSWQKRVLSQVLSVLKTKSLQNFWRRGETKV